MRRLLFGINGRLGRAGFAGASLAVLAVVALSVLGVMFWAMERGAYGRGGFHGPAILIPPIAVLALWCLLALAARRLHDMDLSARHLAWIGAITLASGYFDSLLQFLVGLGPFLWLCLAPGTPGENRFGPGPARA